MCVVVPHLVWDLRVALGLEQPPENVRVLGACVRAACVCVCVFVCVCGWRGVRVVSTCSISAPMPLYVWCLRTGPPETIHTQHGCRVMLWPYLQGRGGPYGSQKVSLPLVREVWVALVAGRGLGGGCQQHVYDIARALAACRLEQALKHQLLDFLQGGSIA